MPRIAESRPPAAPVSATQKQRHRRMLRAASTIGSELPLERVQMHDVAREAGVAIATLYRYFPSKRHLFAALLASQVDRLDASVARMDRDRPPVEALAELLVDAGRRLLERPVLAMNMMQANNDLTATSVGRRVAAQFHAVVLTALGIDDPEPRHLRLVRLVEQSWFGVLTSVINGHTTAEEGEEDLRLAVHLLLVPAQLVPAQLVPAQLVPALSPTHSRSTP